MTFNIRSLFIPSGLRRVDAVELWEVRWRSRYGEYFGDTQDECEVFPIEADAHAFAQALRDAYKLLKHTSGTKVSVLHKIASGIKGGG
jgi:hypothetical protein